MAPPKRSASLRRVLVLAALATLLMAPTAAHALRVVNYNLLNYPGSSGPARAPYYRTVLTPLDADVIVVEEMISSAGATEFLNEVLDVMEPGQWATIPFIDVGGETDSHIYYKPAKVAVLGHWVFFPDLANQLRYIHVFRLQPVGYSSGAAELRIYSAHFKASDTSTDRARRLAEATGLRDSMNAMPTGTHAIISGDLNFYRASNETAYWKLQEDQVNDIGRVYDVLPSGEWHDGASYAPYHTQSPCKDGTCASGAATGGMDDRFDFILPTLNLGTGQGLAVIPGTMIPVGNDGLHLNLNITDAPTIPEGASYATALKLASDHLPLRVDLQLPAEIVADAALAFGTVIVGAPAPSRNLTVRNPATVPADSLNCTFGAPAGFTGPGPLAVAAAESAQVAVTMAAATSGVKSGNLTISSDAPDDPTTLVGLSGTVLDHAQASLDSLVAVASDTLDFGEQTAGGFTPLLAAVHDLGYDALQARLSVTSAQITGGAGHFSLLGFSPVLVAGTAGRWQVQFDDTGATSDSTYEATLVFQSVDEPLPGAAAQPDVQYVLRARVAGGSVAVNPTLPTITRLYPPMPNPLAFGTTLRFDLARVTPARLEIFDLSGRRVTTLADREFTPGRYSLRWDGRGDTGTPAGAGLYFVRLTAPGMAAQTMRLAVVR